MGSKQIWEYKEHFHAIGMTGDYDGYYEVTNGNISLCTNDDPEDITETENTLQRVANALNESGCKFYCNTTTEHKLHVENMELRYKIDDLRDQAQAMADALEKALAPNYRNDKGYWVHPNIVDAEILDAVESALQQFKDGEKEVENG